MKYKDCSQKIANNGASCGHCRTKVRNNLPLLRSVLLIILGCVVFIGGVLGRVLPQSSNYYSSLPKDEIVTERPGSYEAGEKQVQLQVTQNKAQNNTETAGNENISLKGTKWVIPRNDDYYFTLDFISDQHLVQYGYYGEGYGAWTCQYDYSLVGQKGEIFLRHTKIAEFFVNTDKKGNPNTIVLTIYDMEPFGNEEHTVYLIEAPAEEVIAE